MTANHIRVGVLLALGLVAALIVHFMPFGSQTPEAAVPAPQQSVTTSPSPTQTTTAPAPSVSPTVEATTTSPAPSQSVVASPTTTATATATVSPTETASSAAPRSRLDVAGLRASSNSSRSVTFRWTPAPDAVRYAVQVNGATIARVTTAEALILWETPTMRFSVVAEDAAGNDGAPASINVERPGGGSTPAQPQPTRTAGPTTAPTQRPTTAPTQQPTTAPTTAPPPESPLPLPTGGITPPDPSLPPAPPPSSDPPADPPQDPPADPPAENSAP